jgi:hypothetical protein
MFFMDHEFEQEANWYFVLPMFSETVCISFSFNVYYFITEVNKRSCCFQYANINWILSGGEDAHSILSYQSDIPNCSLFYEKNY